MIPINKAALVSSAGNAAGWFTVGAGFALANTSLVLVGLILAVASNAMAVSILSMRDRVQ